MRTIILFFLLISGCAYGQKAGIGFWQQSASGPPPVPADSCIKWRVYDNGGLPTTFSYISCETRQLVYETIPAGGHLDFCTIKGSFISGYDNIEVLSYCDGSPYEKPYRFSYGLGGEFSIDPSAKTFKIYTAPDLISTNISLVLDVTVSSGTSGRVDTFDFEVVNEAHPYFVFRAFDENMDPIGYCFKLCTTSNKSTNCSTCDAPRVGCFDYRYTKQIKTMIQRLDGCY